MADKPQTTYEEIVAGLGGDVLQPFHNQVLLGIYIKPEKTAGGIILTNKTQMEDVYQGKVGFVIGKGPLAFQNDAQNDFKGQDVTVGEAVLYRASDGFPLDINGVHCRMMQDVDIKGRVASPGVIY